MSGLMIVPRGGDAMQIPAPRVHQLSATQIHDRVLEDILSLRLLPGSVIDRAELRSRFGLSSTPVRDALMRIAADGLVEVLPQSGTRVSLIDIGKARESQFLRRALECEAVRAASQAAGRACVQELERLLHRQREAAGAGDHCAFGRHDKAFHQTIFEAAGVPDLFILTRKRSGHIDRIRRLNLPVAGKMQQVIDEHARIVAAIADGDTKKALDEMRAHLSGSLAYLPALLETYPSYFPNASSRKRTGRLIRTKN